MRKVLALLLCVIAANGLVLRAGDEPKSRAQVTKTDRVDFPAGGVLRLNNSIGELTVTGWDRPDVEITTIKSTKALYGSQERESRIQDLQKIQIKTERRGNELVVTTEHPRYAIFPPPLPWHSGHADFELEYRINAPRDARLVVDHDTGEVHVENLGSDINVTVLKGTISLRLPEDHQYAIDAKTGAGGIFSDFPGQMRRRFGLLGYRFSQGPSPDARNLHLRIGFGDIALTKIRKLPYALYNKPTAGAGAQQ